MDKLDFIRGLVRPVLTVSVIGAVIVLTFMGKIDAGELLTMGGMMAAWWFAQRPPTQQGQG